ncbi:hypothetical protein [Burkholderia glumae]|uniref:hypothetical protein n=1 Tax=Burkholderia glumae TaxID=337 RepID=UPI000F5ED27C|nr:hypothetical protein [Burkholderia glumae]MCM2490860.1 hypothetical protein [Burkholderia glumae]MCM2544874.1 hypothetical protein [Burkholderia glumae]MCQ0029690.1 hypothetical protein [Burkholderia glumae]MCQ0035504.1 hypothetical protein [Burkholderia glumae]QJW79750.1 hypothetical protein GAS18_13995 [Burkholderia glumae]
MAYLMQCDPKAFTDTESAAASPRCRLRAGRTWPQADLPSRLFKRALALKIVVFLPISSPRG